MNSRHHRCCLQRSGHEALPQGDLADSSHAALLAGHERLLICLDAVAAEQPAPAIDEALVELTKARNDILAQQAQPEAQDASTAAPQSVADLEEIDPELIDIFFEEAEEILTDMDQSLGQWQDDRDNSVHLENLLRGLHTLKGGARLSRLGGIGDMAHDYESELIQICLLYTSPSPRDATLSRMPSSA